MPRRYALLQLIVGSVVAALALVFGAVQVASDALDSKAAIPGTFPRRVPHSVGVAIYRTLDRIAPAPYVETSLATEALEGGDLTGAERYAVRIPTSPVRDDLLARIALARGQATLAEEYFLAAPDPDEIDNAVQRIASHDPSAGYTLERLLEIRLARSGTHPDAVAQAYWTMGRLANRQAWRQTPGGALQREWLGRARSDFEAAVELSPLSERYVVEAANQADLLGERRRAADLFARGVDIDPASADAVAGLGVVAWENGDRRAARTYLMQARRLDSGALMVRALERDLR